jgi:hypothetical protein
LVLNWFYHLRINYKPLRIDNEPTFRQDELRRRCLRSYSEAVANERQSPRIDGLRDSAISMGSEANPVTGPISRFELVSAELRALGLTLQRLPGEYCVNFRSGGDGTARFADDLDQALELGRAIAAEKAAEQPTTKRPPRRRWRRKRMTPKARRRRFILGHNRRLRARALGKRRGKRKTSAKYVSVGKRPRRRR